MNRCVDVLIAGGGAMGSACAYFLRALDFPGSILIVEPDPGYREAASTRSASSIRQQFSTPVNVALSSFGLAFLKEAAQRLGRDGDGGDVGLVESSYLYLATSQGRAGLERQVAFQQGLGVAVSLHDRAALANRYPWLNTRDLAAGADTSRGEGWFDGHALLAGLRRANERSGVCYLRDRVAAFELSSDRTLAGARLETHGRIECRIAVNAAGTRSRQLAAGIGSNCRSLRASAAVRVPVSARDSELPARHRSRRPVVPSGGR